MDVYSFCDRRSSADGRFFDAKNECGWRLRVTVEGAEDDE